jgi:hypothetical protein
VNGLNYQEEAQIYRELDKKDAKIKQLETDIADLRNFACQLCGRYKTAHEGACDGCRWKNGGK